MFRWFAILSLSASLAKAATWPAASPGEQDVRNAIGMAMSGDTISIPPGTGHWSNQIATAKSLSFVGAGTNLTFLVDHHIGHGGIDTAALSLVGNGFQEISGITFSGSQINGGGNNSPGFPFLGIGYGPGVVKIHDCAFVACQLGARIAGQFGVVYNCSFRNNRGGMQAFGQGNGNPSWFNYAPIPFTSTNFLFFEDNRVQIDTSFYNLNDVAAFISADVGGSYVARHNTLAANASGFSPAFDMHGDTPLGPTSGTRGTIAAEVYLNTISITGSARFDRLTQWRGGSSITYSNTVTANSSNYHDGQVNFVEEFPSGAPVEGTVYHDDVTNSWVWANFRNGATPIIGYCDAANGDPGCNIVAGMFHNSVYTNSYIQPYPHPIRTSSPPPPVGDIRIILPSMSIVENQGSITVTFIRENGSSGAVSANFATANGTAIAGVNYTATNGTVSWPDGDNANKTVDVPVTDTGMTTNRTFTVSLSSPTGGATIGNPGSTTVTIQGSAAGETFSFQSAQSSTMATGTLNVPVVRGSGTAGTVTVDYQTFDVTAHSGTDYTATSGTLSFPPGQSASTNIHVPIQYQSAPTNRTFEVRLQNPIAGTLLVLPTTNVVTITGSGQTVNPGSLTLGISTTSVNETAGSIVVSVIRQNGVDNPVTVNFATADGTAMNGVHYTATNGVLNWISGDSTNKTVTIPIANTGLVGTKFFTFTISNPTGGATTTAPTTLTISIIGSGTQTLAFFSPTSFAATSGLLTNLVVRTNGTAGAVSIDYQTVNGSALAGRDYVATNGTLSLGNGVSSNWVVVPITFQAPTTNRTFTIALSNPVGANLIAPGTNTVVELAAPPPVFPVTITAKTTNAVNVLVTSSLADTNHISSGTTPFVLLYTNLDTITLTAPASISATNPMRGWLVDGVITGTNPSVNVDISPQGHLVNVLYDYHPELPGSVTLFTSSSPSGIGAQAAVSPLDIFGAIGGTFPFDLTYASGVTVGVFATTPSGFAFTGWLLDGSLVSTNSSIFIPLTGNSTLVATYSFPSQRVSTTVKNATFNTATITP